MSAAPASALPGIRATLAACRVFDGLPGDDLETLAEFSRLLRLENGAALFREGDPSRGFFVVQSGVILVTRTDARGREQVIHRLHPGDSFAEASMTAPTGYPADARAIGAAAVVLIPKAEFLAAVARRPELALRILASLSRHVRGLVERMHALTTRDADSRLAGHLLELAPVGTAEFMLPTTRRLLAVTLGMAEETLSRSFARLKAEKILEARARRVRLLDRPALRRLAAGG